MDTLQVGVLLPTSTIIPLGKSFRKGLKKAFSKTNDLKVELHFEFIGNGSPKLIEEKTRKLIDFDDIDVLVGIISNYSLAFMSKFFESINIPVLVNNLGAHVPNIKKLPKNALINSDHMWLQVWSMGHWAVNEFGNKGMIAGGVYDMAYSFSHMLDIGMKAADEKVNWSFAVSHMPEGERNISAPSVVFEFIEKDLPDFLFAFFCGEEADLFLKEYVDRGLDKKVPLIGSPYLFQSLAGLNIDLQAYTSSLHFGGKHLEELKQLADPNQNVFHLMGEETGEWLIDYSTHANPNYELKNTVRGVHNFSLLDQMEGVEVHLYKCEVKANGSVVLSEGESLQTISVEDNTIKDSLNELTSAWFNPYLSL
ncbi:ABC transporter substrate-binding protein [Roseivirga pacifica]|uniref:ABC transporter substrate-binding protein n=1 Tax=Roseivirga pacifica TaxID=1267423 RepID=UPI00227C9113|nr:ABC transporter substrate-binding protein [Roseivirga pacifica]